MLWTSPAVCPGFEVFELSVGDATNKEKLTVFKKWSLNLLTANVTKKKKKERITFLKLIPLFCLFRQQQISRKRDYVSGFTVYQ